MAYVFSEGEGSRYVLMQSQGLGGNESLLRNFSCKNGTCFAFAVGQNLVAECSNPLRVRDVKSNVVVDTLQTSQEWSSETKVLLPWKGPSGDVILHIKGKLFRVDITLSQGLAAMIRTSPSRKRVYTFLHMVLNSPFIF